LVDDPSAGSPVGVVGLLPEVAPGIARMLVGPACRLPETDFFLATTPPASALGPLVGADTVHRHIR
jgi:hypothetical protein